MSQASSIRFAPRPRALGDTLQYLAFRSPKDLAAIRQLAEMIAHTLRAEDQAAIKAAAFSPRRRP